MDRHGHQLSPDTAPGYDLGTTDTGWPDRCTVADRLDDIAHDATDLPALPESERLNHAAATAEHALRIGRWKPDTTTRPAANTCMNPPTTQP